MPVHPQVGSAIIALTDIISEPYPGHSVVPSICRATYDRRLLPGETESDVLAALTELQLPADAQLQVAIATGEYRAFTGNVLACRKWFPAWFIERSHPFVEAAARGLQSAGLAVEYGTYNFCTNGAFSAGIAAVPTIGFGPSPEALAHTVDEYVELEQLHGCARGYRAIIESVLGGDA
jgi:acetylornithine deacetylase/succinyl-diaminopimelate desuccinylase-like protein